MVYDKSNKWFEEFSGGVILSHLCSSLRTAVHTRYINPQSRRGSLRNKSRLLLTTQWKLRTAVTEHLVKCNHHSVQSYLIFSFTITS